MANAPFVLVRPRKTPVPTKAGLSQEARAALRRTRISRLELDARLGIVSNNIRRYMSSGVDNLDDDDIAMLRQIGGLESALDKLRRAKELAAEARAEIVSVMGNYVDVASSKTKKAKKAKTSIKGKKKKTPKVEFKASVVKDPNVLPPNEVAVFNVIKNGDIRMPDLVKATKLTPSMVKTATRGLVDRKLIKLEGWAAGAIWKKV